MSLLCVFVGVLALYVQPARTWLSTWHEASRTKAEVQRLERRHRALVLEQKALRDARTVEQSARRLGMVRQGERSYVIRGLPAR
jgi:cell division protein FtsL